ncbi:hypothetical protein [Candidatus Nitrosocosmicus arcticus]|uniref:Uncharacterized protein n=1 Tax=Candidatus Nitrosocosmicus arcticus TaxID=2035267 RepID=A0A557SSG8_9ARCH|nr:hypothetical protein [Candidatus Nitrosocosmicus arcticus]TVP39549.1 hypothetical protein NARC_140004 [Candidatus Nitrosocosmicus arcticus]
MVVDNPATEFGNSQVNNIKQEVSKELVEYGGLEVSDLRPKLKHTRSYEI